MSNDFESSAPGKSTPIDRLPPHSQESEQGVLGCILIDPATVLPLCIEKFRDGSQVFFDLRNRDIYDTIIELQEDGIGIDLINLVDRLSVWNKLESCGGITYLSSLPDFTPSAANAEDYINTLLEKYTLRRMIVVCTDVVGRIYDHEGDVDVLMDQCERDVLQISESRIDPPNMSMPALFQQVITDVEHSWHHPDVPPGIKSGFPDLDRMTGGLQPGKMILFAARPSMGKSSIAINIAEHVSMVLHLPVGVCSLEMTGKEIVSRIVSSQARVNMRATITHDDIGRITSASGPIAHAPIYIDDTAGQSIIQIRSKMRRWKQQFDIQLGIIDYLQLANAIGNKRRFENRQQEVSDISTGVKNLAKELRIPIIALSQLNREIDKEKNRKPRLSDLRESGSLEQDSDVVGFLYNPNINNDELGDSYQVNLLIAKNRDGPTGDVNLTFFRTFTRFESMARVDSGDVPQQESPQQSLAYNQSNDA